MASKKHQDTEFGIWKVAYGGRSRVKTDKDNSHISLILRSNIEANMLQER